ncbi:MAG: hypothetical protein IT204_17200 [Fimbriimonadaceae bacterium]|nr:hypothetical protein [Fimbriimonadaceae bacterium]
MQELARFRPKRGPSPFGHRAARLGGLRTRVGMEATEPRGQGLLAAAGLPPASRVDVVRAETWRYCPYTGQPLRLVVTAEDGEEDSAPIGEAAFTARCGHVVRYGRDGAEPFVVSGVGDARLRGTLDLLASSGSWQAAHELAPGGAESTQHQPAAAGLPLLSVAARHGRMWFLYASNGQLVLDCRTLPDFGRAAGWSSRSAALPAAAGPDWRPRLQISETAVLATWPGSLRLWHGGTGQPLAEHSWDDDQANTVVAMAADRLLLVRQIHGQIVACRVDLAQLARLGRDARWDSYSLGSIPSHDNQHPWVGSWREGFVVITADAHVRVVPYDGAPWPQPLIDNAAGLQLSPGTVWQPSASGPEAFACFAYSQETRVTALYQVPLQPNATLTECPLGQGRRESYYHAPCWSGDRLYHAWRGDGDGTRLCLGWSSLARLDDVTEGASFADGGDLQGFEPVRLGPDNLIAVRRRVDTLVHHSLVSAKTAQQLQPPLRLTELMATKEIVFQWDGRGLYLCDLQEGRVHVRSPKL